MLFKKNNLAVFTILRAAILDFKDGHLVKKNYFYQYLSF